MDLASPLSASTAATASTAVATVDLVAFTERASAATERATVPNSVVTANLVVVENSATERAVTDMAHMAKVVNLGTVRSLLMANLLLPSTRSTTEKTKSQLLSYKKSYVHK